MNQPPVSRTFRPNEKLLVSIEFTNVCNFRCPFCPQAYQDQPNQPAGSPYNRKTGFMSPTVFARALDECSRVARAVELGFFGEQTLHPQYLEYLHQLRKPRPFRVETNTNISMVTRDMMAAWIASELDLVRLSIDAINPDVYDHVRPGIIKDFDGQPVKHRPRVSVINEKIEHWLSLPDHRPTRVVFVKSSHNQGERQAFLDHWLPRLGTHDTILMKNVLSYGGKILDPLISHGQCNVWKQRYLVIDHLGNTSPCNLDTNMDLHLGNIMSHSIEQLYFSQKAASLRSQTGCGNDITPCRTCHDANYWAANEQFSASKSPAIA